jgi:hypothetical protein
VNDGLFVAAEVIPLTPQEIGQLIRANEPDWSNVEPSAIPRHETALDTRIFSWRTPPYWL